VLDLESFVRTMAAAIPANSDLLRINEDKFLSKPLLLMSMRQWRSIIRSIEMKISSISLSWSIQVLVSEEVGPVRSFLGHKKSPKFLKGLKGSASEVRNARESNKHKVQKKNNLCCKTMFEYHLERRLSLQMKKYLVLLCRPHKIVHDHFYH
jgi:hypothetical protein